jgi:predicted amidohydrolase YtcJ
MAYAGEFFVERYGRKMAERAPAFRDALEAGLPLGLGSDATHFTEFTLRLRF